MGTTLCGGPTMMDDLWYALEEEGRSDVFLVHDEPRIVMPTAPPRLYGTQSGQFYLVQDVIATVKVSAWQRL